MKKKKYIYPQTEVFSLAANKMLLTSRDPGEDPETPETGGGGDSGNPDPWITDGYAPGFSDIDDE